MNTSSYMSQTLRVLLRLATGLLMLALLAFALSGCGGDAEREEQCAQAEKSYSRVNPADLTRAQRAEAEGCGIKPWGGQ